MINLNDILAKSINYGGLTLEEHTRYVLQAIEKFALEFDFNFDVNIARKGAIFHDLGKAHPIFQDRIKNVNAKSLVEAEKLRHIKHRHEISSLAFLPVLDRSEWNTIIDLVVGHHKSIEKDPRERGILDIYEKERDIFKVHLKDWDTWSPYGFLLLEHFGIRTKPISYKEAEDALQYVVDYCETKKGGWSPLRGLLKAADHFASAFNEKTAAKLINLFQVPDLSFYHQESRKSSLYPLSQIPTDDYRPHTLVVAPTGAGKTDFLLRRCKGRVFYTLPFQASINAMFQRIRSTVEPKENIRLLHSTSKIIAQGEIDEQILQPLAGSSVKVLTPHQIAAIIFGTGGFETVMLDLKGTDVILDEIHTYTDLSKAMVLEITKALLRLNCRLHIGTATMPAILYNQILDLLGGEMNTYQVRLPDEILDTFDRHVIHKVEDVKEIQLILQKAFASREKVLIIFNTVRNAQEAYKKLTEIFPDVPAMLIHSRFRRENRVELERKLKEEFNGDSENFKGGICPCMVISTQVVEVSLDISFDRMITECAPLDGLIQRFGRVNRKRTPESVQNRLLKPVHVLKPEGKCLPYNREVVLRSYEQLTEGEVLKEKTLQARIDEVYPQLDSREIDMHLIFQDGNYRIKELTNRKKSVLVDALEIESATCILECDREAYETAGWEERLYMEIPVNFKSIFPYRKKYIQIEIGSYPFVIPQPMEEHEKLGLILTEHEKFL